MKIKTKRIIEAPKDLLWEYVSDYANIQRFHPLLKNSEFIEGTQTCEVGSTRRCDMKNGTYIKERVTDWKEGSHYTVEIYESDMPIKSASATVGLREINENKTEAYMEVEMKSKYWILSPLLYLMYKYHGTPAILKGLDDLQKKENEMSMA